MNSETILDLPFSSGQNIHDFELKVDLRLVRNFHKTADLEAQLREESSYYQLDENSAYLMDSLKMNFKINGKVEERNFDLQLKKLKRKAIAEIHYHNLLYLVKTMLSLEKKLFTKHKEKFSLLRNDVNTTFKLAKYLESGVCSKVQVDLFGVSTEKLAAIPITDNDECANIISSLLTVYKNRILINHWQLLQDLMEDKLNENTIRFKDLESILLNLDKYIKANGKTAFRHHYMSVLFNYIKYNELIISGQESKLRTYPNSMEARLIYFVLCINNLSPILLYSEIVNGSIKSGASKQNDNIINRVIIYYKRVQSVISKAPKDNDIFELYFAKPENIKTFENRWFYLQHGERNI